MENQSNDYLKLYLKRVNTKTNNTVEVYRDKECTDLKAVFNGRYTTLPNKRRKILTINNFNFLPIWL